MRVDLRRLQTQMKRRKRWWIVGGRVGRAVSGCAGVGVGVVDVDVVRRGRQHVRLVRRRHKRRGRQFCSGLWSPTMSMPKPLVGRLVKI